MSIIGLNICYNLIYYYGNFKNSVVIVLSFFCDVFFKLDWVWIWF